ncbi:ABC transporter ATP-binding protein/permease [Mameliella sp. CS4]|uniref:ABC transporter transmembrane domain-containing protein n=1 Tax=Mameliella sp. CS4 TaxID=2862329 RepID=UPI001C5E7DBF|nr:ABC transporter ATP-binding protein [Mameliella sp. CS4]MBW4984996.1 ABC transporter ATP-binding protein/permease [Mameliella sp. CS4]
MKHIPRIAQGERRQAFMLLVAAALGQGAMLVVSALAVREAIGVARTGGQIIPFGAFATLAGAGVGLAVLRYAERVLAERVAQNYVSELREMLFLRFSKAPALWLAQRRAGALSLRFVGDLTAIRNWVGVGLARTISASTMLPIAFVVLCAIDLRLGFGAGVPVALTLAIILRLGPPLREAQAEARKRRARLAATMSERLQQATALRRSGRMSIEKRALRAQSAEIIATAMKSARLSAAIRAMPDAASGIAGAVTLLICFQYEVPIGETVAALLTLSMIVRPMRHIADIRDRRSTWLVASEKLEKALNTPQIKRLGRQLRDPRDGRAALMVRGLPLADTCIDLKLSRGAIRLLTPEDSAKSSLLLMLAGGLEEPEAGYFRVLGRHPAELAPQALLYLGGASPTLRGSLRRDVLLGTGRTLDDEKIISVLETLGLRPLLNRIGGLNGRIDEGRRNLSAAEQRGVLLARGLLAQPKLALIDADEIGLGPNDISMLISHFRDIGSAALIATSMGGGSLADEVAITLEQTVPASTVQKTKTHNDTEKERKPHEQTDSSCTSR